MFLVTRIAMQEIVFFIPTKCEAEKRLMDACEGLHAGAGIRISRDADGLRKRLVRSMTTGIHAVVILPATKQDLLSIVSLRDVLSGFRIVVILPDADSETLAAGWSMWPRFVSYADGDFQDVAGVLQKMIGTAPWSTREGTTHERQSFGSRAWGSLRSRPVGILA